MSTKRENQKRRLKRLIREACGPQPREDMPCPISTANQIKSAGANTDEFMNWVGELIDSYNSSNNQIVSAPIHDPLSNIAVERYQQNRSFKTSRAKSSLRTGSTIFGVGFGDY